MRGVKVFTILCLLAVAAGCSALQPAVDTVKAITAKVVSEYCKGSPNIRAAIRAEFAPSFAPNKVKIECASDET